jgi:F5/8 type C domain
MKTKISLLLAAAVAFFALVAVADEPATNSDAAPGGPAGPVPAPALTVPAPVAATNKIVLTVVKVDSEETASENGSGTNAVDGNPNTFWHTQWTDTSPEPPHEIIIELTPPSKIKGFTYLPRQDNTENGSIKDYEFYVSDDGKDFGQPVCKGTFETGKDKRTVTFDPVKCRFIKLKALSEVNGEAWTSAAEIGVVPNE